jgi:preprotein translocase subunit SecD
MTQRQWLLLGLILIIAAFAVSVDLTNREVAFELGPIKFKRDIRIHQGLDLQGGMQVLLQARVPEGKTPDADAMEAARQIIENRVNGLGVTEPLVQIQGSDKIVVELPGIRDPEQAIKTFGQTGLLEFADAGELPLFPGDKVETTYPVLYEEFIQTPTPTSTPVPTGTPTPAVSPTLTTAITGTGTVTGTGAITGTAGTEGSPTPEKPVRRYTTVITGQDLKNAQVIFDQTTGAPEVGFELRGDCSPQPCISGSKRFFDYTSKNVGKILAIVLDKEVISAPRVQSGISDQGRITGRFTLDEARSLVIQLKYGALPVPLEVINRRTVGASLGTDSVRRSITAGLIGLTTVLLFMIIYYRLPGSFAALALLIYAALNLAIYKVIPVTLTLPGIAGFLLSTGMAVDANILIFERMKEELRWGRTLRKAVEAGFNRAWTSILDSNLSTLIICLILIVFGSTFGAQSVKGFAVNLGIGVLVSMFTAVTVTRTFMGAVFSRGDSEALREKHWLMGI